MEHSVLAVLILEELCQLLSFAAWLRIFCKTLTGYVQLLGHVQQKHHATQRPIPQWHMVAKPGIAVLQPHGFHRWSAEQLDQ